MSKIAPSIFALFCHKKLSAFLAMTGIVGGKEGYNIFFGKDMKCIH